MVRIYGKLYWQVYISIQENYCRYRPFTLQRISITKKRAREIIDSSQQKLDDDPDSKNGKQLHARLKGTDKLTNLLPAGWESNGIDKLTNFVPAKWGFDTSEEWEKVLMQGL